MYDPELKYCPKCNDEYVARVEVCAACDVPLLTGQEMNEKKQAVNRVLEGRKGPIGPDESDLVSISKGPMAEMRRLEQQLNKYNIGTQLVGGGGSCGKSCCAPEVDLVVRREEVQSALDVLNLDYDQQTGINDFDVSTMQQSFQKAGEEMLCPACGSQLTAVDNECPDCGLCF